MNDLIQNPLAQGMSRSSETGMTSTAGSQAEEARAIEEVTASMKIAKLFPRDEVRSMDKILMACASPVLAESAIYVYGRGGAEVSGPSIRLAEAIAQNWGNITFGWRELSQRAGASEIECFAWDLETNTRIPRRFVVPHVRYSKANGNTLLTDPRDIYEVCANMASRRLRACILSVIRSDVVEAAVQQCELTLKAKADVSEAGIKKMLAGFERYGVTKAHVEAKIQRRVEAITPAQMVQLIKVFTAIKDGLGSAADYFDLKTDEPETVVHASRTEAVKAKISKTVEAPKQAIPVEVVPEPVQAQEAVVEDVFEDEVPDTLKDVPVDAPMANEDVCDECSAKLTFIEKERFKSNPEKGHFCSRCMLKKSRS